MIKGLGVNPIPSWGVKYISPKWAGRKHSSGALQGCNHLPEQPVGLGLVVQVFGEDEFLAVGGVNFQIIVNRMTGGCADIRSDVFDLGHRKKLLLFEGKP